ncbi:MAG: circadian clock KaiB family protein [Candidatus Bathyarchaeia archaeon]
MSNDKGVPQGSLSDFWVFKLFICGQTPRSAKAYLNLKQVCEDRLDSKYKIEVVDLAKDPAQARDNNIMACPTVVKESPSPKARVIGDLSRTDAVVAKLDLPTVSELHRFGKARSVSFVRRYFS